MDIGGYRTLVGPMEATENIDDALVLAGEVVAIERPIHAQPLWTKLVLSISNAWHLSNSFVIDIARARAKSHAVELKSTMLSRRHCVTDFVDGMCDAYGIDISKACLVKCRVNLDEPLTARKVISVLQKADEARSHYVGINENSIRRFLVGEPLNGGDEPTLATVANQRLGLECRCDLSVVIGVHAEKFITDYLECACRALPEYARSILPNSVLVTAAEEALTLYRELAGVAGMTRESTGRLLLNASREGGIVEIRKALGKAMLTAVTTRQLDVENPRSLLVLAGAPWSGDVGKGGTEPADVISGGSYDPSLLSAHSPVPGSVLESLSVGMTKAMQEKQREYLSLLCQGVTLGDVVRLFEQLMAISITNAVAGHREAQRKIRTERKYSKLARGMFAELAARRRLDLVQLAVYEAMLERQRQSHLARIALAVNERRYGWVIGELQALLAEFTAAEKTMLEQARALKDSASLPQGEALMGEFFRFALCSMAWAEADRLFSILTADNGHRLVQGLIRNPQGRALLAVYSSLAFEFGRRAGTGEQGLERLARLSADRLNDADLLADLPPSPRPFGKPRSVWPRGPSGQLQPTRESS